MQGFHIAIYLDDILVLVHSKLEGNLGRFTLDYILIFPSLTFILLRLFVFFQLCWDTIHMVASLPHDQLADIQQLTFSLLWTQPVTVHQVVLLRQGQFLCQWPLTTVAIVSCHFEWHVDCFIILQPNYFLLSIFPFQLCINLSGYLICNIAQFLCNVFFLMWLLLQMPCPLIGPFIFRGLDCHYQLVDPGQVLCAGLILPCRDSKQLPWCCIEWLGRPIICYGVSCFQSGILFLTWPKWLFTFGVFQSWIC